MDKNTISFIVEIVIIVVSFFAGKYFFSDKTNITMSVITNSANIIREISDWADMFVHYARQFMKDSTGSEKMNYVVESLKKRIDSYNESLPNGSNNIVSFTTEQLIAIAQKAYDEMINKENK